MLHFNVFQGDKPQGPALTTLWCVNTMGCQFEVHCTCMNLVFDVINLLHVTNLPEIGDVIEPVCVCGWSA